MTDTESSAARAELPAAAGGAQPQPMNLALLAIVVWYFRYGRFVAGDEEFIKARREMRKSFCFWLV